MSLGDHLRELRNRTLIAILAILLGSIVGWVRWQEIYDALVAPIAAVANEKKAAGAIVTTSFGNLTDSFTILLVVGLFVGVVISSPVWLWELWAFVLPGLTTREKRVSMAFFAAAVPLFLAGCALAFAVLPRAVQTLLSFTPAQGSNIIYAPDYLSFVLKFILTFGIGFLLPVLLVGLNVAHVLPARVMRKGWRGAVFLCFLFTAVMTPDPSPWTMIVLALPLVALFFLAVGISTLLDRRRAKRDPTAEWLDLPDDQASAL